MTDDDAAADTSVLASVRDLSVDFQRGGRCVHALRGVSLEVRSGEILALVGESGSGKSVLGLSLLGLVRGEPAPRTTGVVEVCGVDMLGAEESARRAVRREHLGAVFQDPMTSLNPTMRVGRQVEEAAGSTAEALRMLELVGVPGAASRMSAFPHELSGGLRQRVMIAMAFAGEPRLVIADEPTTALDVTVQAQVLELMSTLRDETGCSVVMITHDVGVASQISDRTAVLYGGRLAELGRTSDVLGRPSHPYTRGLLGARIGLDQDRHRPVVALAGEPPDPAEPPRGCPFAPRCVAVEPACESQLPDPRPAPSHSGSTACLRAPEEWPPEPSSELPALQDADLASAPPVLSVNGVSKTYTIRKGVFGRRTLHALSDVVLSVRSGETVAIVGESGSGKSTLLRVAASLESADEGRVEQYGDVGPQMIFQDAGASLTPWMTVGELVGERLGRTRRSDRSARVREALARVGLPDEVAGVKAMSLSGGQRQRVAFARATIVAPRVLLCDEPTSALDASLAAVVLNLLRRMRDELSMGVVFVTHDLAAARFVADRIAVMYLGKIVEIGDAEEIVGSPMHPYTRSLLRAVPRSGAPPARLKGEPASPLDVPSGCAFHPRCVDRLDHCGDRVPSLLSPDGSSTKLVSCWLHRNPPEADGHEM